MSLNHKKLKRKISEIKESVKEKYEEHKAERKEAKREFKVSKKQAKKEYRKARREEMKVQARKKGREAGKPFMKREATKKGIKTLRKIGRGGAKVTGKVITEMQKPIPSKAYRKPRKMKKRAKTKTKPRTVYREAPMTYPTILGTTSKSYPNLMGTSGLDMFPKKSKKKQKRLKLI